MVMFINWHCEYVSEWLTNWPTNQWLTGWQTEINWSIYWLTNGLNTQQQLQSKCTVNFIYPSFNVFQVIGLMGTVHRITERGDVRIQHPGFANRWTFHPASLTKVYTCSFVIIDSFHLVNNYSELVWFMWEHSTVQW